MGSNAANGPQEAHKNRLRATAFVVSLVMYLIFVGVNFDPAVTKAQVGVAGERPFGIPAQVFFAGLNAILFFPIFWWTCSRACATPPPRKSEKPATLRSRVFCTSPP